MANNPLSGKAASATSIPLDVTLRLAALFPFEVLQDTGIGPNGKVVITPTAKRRQAGRHAEAVQVARNVERGLRDFLRLEVIARVEVDRPLVRNLDIPVDVQRI